MSTTRLIRELEAELSAAAAKHTEIHWRLLRAKSAKLQEDQTTAAAIERASAKRRGEVDDLPADPTARAIVLAGRRARNEIQ
jgi:ribosome-interacting GTPase 1